MNPAADPAFVAAEVAYRFETGRIVHSPTQPPRQRRIDLRQWLRRMDRRGTRHRAPRHQRA